ncbi:RrF2 family transcriptional regulator [Roseateles terrae]|uniref:DNA-binding IscR family transcriptional regulator n=1 Tax=Roseateles terrae TaxID=431060 RepID=A0ABR6GNC3_9BURK|nr:Rrf2 family transcriptional regulator [Roseateles terrae]MBB3193611.1 DNA-binding IscR family transcriptional regulator [Roseateles terrae]OWQ89225.1 transcriptional regulator [Roseateles terrae]
MSQNFQLSDILHVLLHMAERDGPTTSEALAAAMGTNPVVLRRLMAGMRSAGFVVSGKGHGGGWALGCDLERITLGDVYLALGEPRLISLGFREDHPTCLVAAAVNDAMRGVIQDAEALLLKRFGDITLATLSADFHRRMTQQKAKGPTQPHQLEHHLHEDD